jgi:mRNA interferase HicA
VKGAEFIRRVEKLGRARRIKVEFIPRRGKGSHGTLFFGSNFTIVQNRVEDLKRGTLHGMLKQLGLTIDDIQ